MGTTRYQYPGVSADWGGVGLPSGGGLLLDEDPLVNRQTGVKTLPSIAVDNNSNESKSSFQALTFDHNITTVMTRCQISVKNLAGINPESGISGCSLEKVEYVLDLETVD